jgi:hypothetical protein
MSLLKPINLSSVKGLQSAIAALINGKAGPIELSETVNLKVKRNGDSVELVITDGTAEISLKGLPDPDIVKIKAHRHYAIVSLTLADVRVDY